MKLTKDQQDLILAQVMQAKAAAEDDHAANIERWNDNYLYYTAQKPGPMLTDEYLGLANPDSVDYVEPVVYNAVKGALPQLLDSFTENDRLAVAFRSRGYRKNEALENLITDNLNKIFLQEQDGYAILENLIKEALITGDSFGKVYVNSKTERETDTVTDWVELAEYVSTLVEGWIIELPKSFGDDKKGKYKGFEWKETTVKGVDPLTQQEVAHPILLIRGAIPLMNIKEKIKVEFVEQKDLWVDTSKGSNFEACPYICHRIETTVGEAKLMGYDPEIIARAAQNDKEPLLEPMYFKTNGPISDTQAKDNNGSTDPDQQIIYLYDHYYRSALIHKKGETRLYQTTTTGSEHLKTDEIAFMPFVHGQAETLVGSFFGRGFADQGKQYQDQLTKFARLNMHVGVMNTFPSFLGVAGQYDRKSVLQIHRPGAIADQKMLQGIQRFEPLTLPQGFYTNQELLQQSAENTLSLGKAATEAADLQRVSTAALAMSLYDEAQQGMTLSKNIARTLIKPLYSLIYEVIKAEGWELEDQQGNKYPGDNLPEVYEMVVDWSTKEDDAARIIQIQNLTQTMQMLSQISAPWFTPDNAFYLLTKMCESSDLDMSKALTDPQTQQDPHAAVEQAEMKAIESEMNKITLQRAIIAMRKEAADAAGVEIKNDEMVKDGNNKRQIDREESLHRMAKIVSDAQAKTDANTNKAAEVKVKDKAVTGEIVLNAAKHETDIIVNGIR
ncbi:hypothetical protein HZV87_004435 [Salmonella enterica]|nr:hypothetical protein [Salmonella enterica]